MSVQSPRRRKCELVAFTFGTVEPHTPRVKSLSHDLDLAPRALAELRRGDTAEVVGLVETAAIDAGRSANESLVARLRDLGFVSGAHCEVIARMWPGGDPMAVRIGGSTFALRRAEAAAVQVRLARAPDTLTATLAPTGTSAAAA
jgi:ferrous iron transport protein A